MVLCLFMLLGCWFRGWFRWLVPPSALGSAFVKQMLIAWLVPLTLIAWFRVSHSSAHRRFRICETNALGWFRLVPFGSVWFRFTHAHTHTHAGSAFVKQMLLVGSVGSVGSAFHALGSAFVKQMLIYTIFAIRFASVFFAKM